MGHIAFLVLPSITLVSTVVLFGLMLYHNKISGFLRAISDCSLAGRARYYPPTTLHRLLVDRIQFRIRRKNTQYCLEFRSLLTGWHTIGSSSHMGPEFYGRWYETWVHDIESPKRRLKEVQTDISKWLVDSATIDYTQYDDRVIETIKYNKDDSA